MPKGSPELTALRREEIVIINIGMAKLRAEQNSEQAGALNKEHKIRLIAPTRG